MASASAAVKEWREGDCCLAPSSPDGILREATIQRLTSSTQTNDTAWLIFRREPGEEEQKQEAISVTKLMRSGLKQSIQEKPVFPGSNADTILCTPLHLRDEDRVPYTINRYLRDYQRDGIRFIYNNYMSSTGCILGDDMGLGKTVQIIGFLAAVLHKTGTWEDVENNRPQFLQTQIPSNQSNPSKVFLIVAPLSVLYNWKDELDTWGYFQCVVVHGLRKEEELARIKNGRVEIALTTYETLRLCLDQFNKINWSAVVVDEAHKIKNPESQITQSMKELRCKNRIGLTGTILQNNLEELWCVMDWANPGCLGNLGHFKNNFSDPIEKGQRHSATKRALATGRKTVRALVRKIAPFFLRRTKALIKEQLPKKDDRVVYCSLTDFQQTVYQAVLDTEDVTLLLRSSEKCDCQSGRTRRGCCYQKNSQGVYVKHLYFTYLAILRKVANHAALLQSTSSTSKKQERYVSSVCSKVFQKFPDFVQRCKNEAFEALSDPMYSGKMKVLQKLLKYYLQKRDKVLIFSLSTKLLNILESYCMAEGLDFSRLDGTTKSRERVQIVKEFNSSSHVNLCLVSTMAGGLGLNFVGANVVVLFDPTWNPANDLQAIDRAYRIGQCRDVTVLRLISLGTVEEVIYLRQLYKQQLQCSVVGKESARRYFEAVQGKSVYKGELFGIKNLFRLQTEGTCLTRRILEREGQVEAGVITTKTHKEGEKENKTSRIEEHGDDTLSKDEAPEENMHVSRIPKGVLDFSSGSETDEELQGPKPKTTNSSAGHGNRSGKAAGGPVHMSLLQHGFSRLLETIKDRQQLREGDCSSSAEGSPFEEEAGDQKIDDTCTGIRTTSCEGNGVARLPESETKPQNKSIGSDRKDRDDGNNILLLKEGDHAERQRWGLKRRLDKQIAVDEESDGNSSPENNKASRLKTTVTKVHQFEGCSDESEDVDLEAQICSQRGASNLQNKEDDGGRRKPGRSRRRQSAGARDKARSKFTEAIEAFTSSEDERSAPGRRAGRSEVASFTRLRGSTTPASEEKEQTIDNVLGRVQEVTYMHSNQRVVGGSRAEELISRAAVRDVFERKMYSQLPANNLLGTQESLPASLPGSQPKSSAIHLQRPKVDHPVIFSDKKIQHTGCTTVIIGDTPKAVCRQQLEEMAQHFKFASVHQFATEILKGSSSHRLDWLCRYYASLNHSDVAEAVRENFPDTTAQPSSPTTAAFSSSTKMSDKTQQIKSSRVRKIRKYSQTRRTNPTSPQSNVSSPQSESGVLKNNGLEPPKKARISEKNLPDPLQDVQRFVSEEQEEMVSGASRHSRTQKSSVSTAGACRAGSGLAVDRARGLGQGSRESAVAAFPNHTDRDCPSSSDLRRCSSATLSKPTAQDGEQGIQESSRRTGETSREGSEPPSALCSNTHLKDLIGDTSILDDLLKPKGKNVQQKSAPKTPPVSSLLPNPTPDTSSSPKLTLGTDSSSGTQNTALVQTSRSARKDIWDILSEGNEERINKLTDPEVVQKVCINTTFAARGFSGQNDSKNLWKTNDKFLWRK
ncbi:PREDICTED: DNA excision repair protein ERCC-6-like 2 isoform X1 [Poecilia mexicana]|uniref:DNA excision repair protein ERCC-6-like 2 isoform X1 n=1 Tax=Poecilia mexicana TaxID=48701 RepID=UPI00072E3398|nr:PREDICTED: DNA excision repair protein ERCC-6-like 2 isoform X1 [Poecilia mexicana]